MYVTLHTRLLVTVFSCDQKRGDWSSYKTHGSQLKINHVEFLFFYFHLLRFGGIPL